MDQTLQNRSPIITLLTDFGMQDGYVASMKGVILGICPTAILVDVSHLIPPQDVRAGAFILSTVYKDFPVGTVHLAVVDPGVGTKRRSVVLKAAEYYFVGPDNGLFSWVLQHEPAWQAYSLENSDYWQTEVSRTFHGRDIFAPTAAHLASGKAAKLFGPSCQPILAQWSKINFGENQLLGEVIYVDHFGNVITNLRQENLQHLTAVESFILRIGSYSVTRFVSTYAEARVGEPAALIGSSGYLEVAVNGASAAEVLNVRRGESVALMLRESSG